MSHWRRAVAAATATVALSACGGGAAQPAAIDTRHDACRFCRMTVSDVRFAAQIVAPGDEPLAFDDLGCLGAYLAAGQALREDAAVFVADHRTREWLRADAATFTRVGGVETPMGSHLMAHGSAASRDADPDAQGGAPVPADEVLHPAKGHTP